QSPPSDVARGTATRRLGDAGRARVRVAPARRAAGGCLRRSDVLRADLTRGAAGRGAARLHRSVLRACGRGGSTRRAPVALSWALRACARVAADDRGPGAA